MRPPIRSKILFYVAAVVFLAIAGFELRAPLNLTAVVVNALAGGIFLLLGALPQKPKP
jgi:hypothetical protein